MTAGDLHRRYRSRRHARVRPYLQGPPEEWAPQEANEPSADTIRTVPIPVVTAS